MAKVLKAFRDKVTKRLYAEGDTYDGERVDELSKIGYVEAPKHRKAKKDE